MNQVWAARGAGPLCVRSTLLALIVRLVRRFGLIAYWLAFAVYTLDAARHSGLVAPGTIVPYPWFGVIVIWTLLAVLVGVLHAILRPLSFNRSWGRLLGALTYALTLVALAYVTFATDMAGHAYVPSMFAIVTTLGILALSATVAVHQLMDRFRSRAT